MGIDQDFARAFAKSQSAAGSQLPKSGGVLFSLTDRDKQAGAQIAKELSKLGFELFATESTAAYFRQQGLEVRTVLKLTEGRPNVADVIKNREVVLVINTPSGQTFAFRRLYDPPGRSAAQCSDRDDPGRRPRRSGRHQRHARRAYDGGVPSGLLCSREQRQRSKATAASRIN